MNETDLDEFKEILGMKKECIEIDWSGSDTGIEWNDKKKCWEIEYNDLGFDFQLIHELGHIYLYKKTKYIYFAKKPSVSNSIRFDIWWCHNAIIDSFVNHQITRFSKIYSLYKDYISAVVTRNINPPEMYMWFGGYIEYYLAFHYNLHDEEKNVIVTSYNHFIDRVKSAIQQYARIDNKKLDLIDSVLNDFNNLKSTISPNDIKDFDFKILNSFPLVDESKLKSQFKLLYPNL